ncbi:hypothetical protein WA158_007088 [Blastocystis sp. Blastoise]
MVSKTDFLEPSKKSINFSYEYFKELLSFSKENISIYKKNNLVYMSQPVEKEANEDISETNSIESIESSTTIMKENKINTHLKQSEPIENDMIIENNNKEEEYKNEHEYLLVICTTLIDTNVERKIQVQKNAIYTWSLMKPKVKLIIFTQSEYWQKYCNETGVTYHTKQKFNRYGTPYFSSMIGIIEQTYDSMFYGYINGDILVSQDIITIMEQLTCKIYKKELKEKVMLMGRRYNRDSYFDIDIGTTKDSIELFIDNTTYLNEQFITVSIDYFIFTKPTLNLRLLKPIVVGRNFIDGYFVNLCYHDKSMDFIDLSNALKIVHQNDKKGTFAGEQNKDGFWNKQKVGKELLDHESIRHADWFMYKYNDGTYKLLPWTLYDDEYTQEEMNFLSKYIHKTDNVLSYNYGYSEGKLGQFAKYILNFHYDVWYFRESNGDKTIDNADRDKKIPDVFNKKLEGMCQRYRLYYKYVFEKKYIKEHKLPQFNIYLLDSVCTIHILQEIYSITPENALFIVKGLNTDKFRGYKPIISEGYELIDSLPASDHNIFEWAVYKKKPTNIISQLPL